MNLLPEMEQAASRVRVAHLEKLRTLGVPYAELGALSAEQHTVGIARIQPQPDGWFDYSEDGVLACLVAVVDHWRGWGDAGIYDIVAFTSDKPSRWWGRTGSAFAIGEHLLDLGEPTRVVATPVEWLACGGNAFCLLAWAADSQAWAALRACPPLQFTNDLLRRKLRNAIVSAARVPQMELIQCAA